MTDRRLGLGFGLCVGRDWPAMAVAEAKHALHFERGTFCGVQKRGEEETWLRIIFEKIEQSRPCNHTMKISVYWSV